jgi:hypothetical protein
VPPKPYTELGCRSIFDMTQVTSTVTTKGVNSAMNRKAAELS